MLISYSHRFLFFHVFKTAGTSVRAALKPYAHVPDALLVNGLIRIFRLPVNLPWHRYRIFLLHTSAREARQYFPRRMFEEFFKFSFVRNPWDLQVSLYHYVRAQEDHWAHDYVCSLPDFDAFLHWWVEQLRNQQLDFLVDEHGKPMMDFVGRNERLDEDFAHVCRTVGIDAALPRLNVTPREDYRTYYSDASAQLVAEHFARDIEAFGYAFDDGAVRDR
jgi:hypothetical protein